MNFPQFITLKNKQNINKLLKYLSFILFKPILRVYYKIEVLSWIV